MAELQEFMIQGNLNKKEYKAFAPIGTDEEYILNNFRKSENYVKPDEYRPYDFNELNKLVGGKHFEAPFNKDSLKKYRQLVKDFGYGNTFASVILGNGAYESGGSFNYSQKERDKSRTDIGIGIWQYSNKTRGAYKNWTAKNNIEDSGWAQIKFMQKLLDGSIKQEDGTAWIGNGNVLDLKDMVKNPKTTMKQYNDWFIDTILIPKNPSKSRGKRFTASEYFYELLSAKTQDNLTIKGLTND